MRYGLGVAQASLLALAAAAQPDIPAGLRVVNGDFSDLTGLSAHSGAPGWYDGVPTGWQTSATDTAYCLHAQGGATPPRPATWPNWASSNRPPGHSQKRRMRC